MRPSQSILLAIFVAMLTYYLSVSTIAATAFAPIAGTSVDLTKQKSGFTIKSFAAWIGILALLELPADTDAGEVASALAWLLAGSTALIYGTNAISNLNTAIATQ